MSDLGQLGRVMRSMPKADQVATEAEIQKAVANIKCDLEASKTNEQQQTQIEISEFGAKMNEE